MTSRFTLISHSLCPYVQRVVIVLEEKVIPYERIDVDLANKPEWFLKVSPLGKTPVLLVDGMPIFESTVICEYLEEITPHRMHSQDPLARAQHRAWMEFASATLNAIGAMYGAPDERTLAAKVGDLRAKFTQIEAEQSSAEQHGPYFAGESFCMVDAAFSPVFRYFDVFDTIDDFGIFTHTPRVRAWRIALQQRDSVRKAVRADYPELLRDFLIRRKSELSRRMTQTTIAAN
ncbi:MAG: glutathione S-transferase family protein [Polaromonas sp.]|uniref:glutathione S-transferase family protein n=1 Tax=Polaromonas sp. TaxID=1869339 RepID=UPI002487CF72|nr:glutathione S-transferase family protein [Polaromonas sp.]MDI1269423.1 glutathione S-transferase family protein [Polaromonas sp.]